MLFGNRCNSTLTLPGILRSKTCFSNRRRNNWQPLWAEVAKNKRRRSPLRLGYQVPCMSNQYVSLIQCTTRLKWDIGPFLLIQTNKNGSRTLRPKHFTHINAAQTQLTHFNKCFVCFEQLGNIWTFFTVYYQMSQLSQCCNKHIKCESKFIYRFSFK